MDPLRKPGYNAAVEPRETHLVFCRAYETKRAHSDGLQVDISAARSVSGFTGNGEAVDRGVSKASWEVQFRRMCVYESVVFGDAKAWSARLERSGSRVLLAERRSRQVVQPSHLLALLASCAARAGRAQNQSVELLSNSRGHFKHGAKDLELDKVGHGGGSVAASACAVGAHVRESVWVWKRGGVQSCTLL